MTFGEERDARRPATWGDARRQVFWPMVFMSCMGLFTALLAGIKVDAALASSPLGVWATVAASLLCGIGVFLFARPYIRRFSRQDAFARRGSSKQGGGVVWASAFIGTIGIALASVVSAQPQLVEAAFLFLGSVFFAVLVGFGAAIRAIK